MNHTVTDSAGWNRIRLLEQQIEALHQQIADMNDYIDDLERQCLALGGLLGEQAKP